MTDPQIKSPRVVFSISVGAGLLTLILLAVALADGFGRDPREPENIANQGAKIDMTRVLPLLDGTGELAFSELEGKILVINFWASYCIPCRAEHEVLTTASEQYRDQNVQFLGIVFHDDPDAARDFLDTLGWGDGYLYVEDPGARATVDFGVWGVPETYFVDATGTIVDKHYGAITRDDLIPVLESILAGDSAG
jgi:cytochrome c biogenesis protein CcmG/thiol:disulfide interchange protein DsbE